MESKTELNLQSDNKSTSITNYQPLFIPCYHKGELHIAIRSYDRRGLSYYLLVNPNTLTTHIVLKGTIQHRKQTTDPKEIGYYTKEQIERTPYGLALKHINQSPHPIANDGITHSMCEHEPNQFFLTIDLCPSKKLFEKNFFDKLVSMGSSAGKPISIAICITEFWRTTHVQEFEWLLEQQQKGILDITWVNHSATHVYYHDCASPERLNQNFLLESRTNLLFEIFEIEKALIECDQVPSVFFRAPGLVTDEKLMKELDKFGLITLGADAWLAKEQQPSSGSIILVHGNSNEPAGIKKMMEILEKGGLSFLPIQRAFPAPDKVKEYLDTMQCLQPKKIPHLSAHTTQDAVFRGDLLESQKIKFNDLLASLQIKTKELIEKGKQDNKLFDPRYIEIGKAAASLNLELEKAGNLFFKNPTATNFQLFKQTCNAEINAVATEFKHNRSPWSFKAWNEINPILKEVLGLIALLTLIPALLVAIKSKHGYVNTFFSNRQTESFEKLRSFEKGKEEIIQTVGSLNPMPC